jgi:hypothetical protein
LDHVCLQVANVFGVPSLKDARTRGTPMNAKPADPTAAGIAMLLSVGRKPVTGPKPVVNDPPQTPAPVARPAA